MKALLKSTFGIVAAVMLLFAVMAAFVARNTSALMVEEAERTLGSVVSATTMRINVLMAGVETAVANQRWVVEEHLREPDYMYRITHRLVEDNEFIVGSAIAFEPDCFPDRGETYSPYSCADLSGAIRDFPLPYDYRDCKCEWYHEPKTLRRAHWCEPYYDEGGGEVLMCTYSMPLTNAQGKVYAVITSDISLAELQRYVAALRPYPDSYAVMTSGKGSPLVSPPVAADDGVETISIREQANNGWTVEVVCPVEKLLGGARQLVWRIVLFSLLGLVLIFLLAWFFSSRLQRSAALRERMEGELNAAHRIQADILPKDFPAFVYALLKPAREVGGDLYDFVRLGEKLYFIIGDASGKGVPAALFSFMAGTVFRMACGMGLGPGEILARINAALAHNNEMCMFVTAFVGALDLKTGELEFGCAGHNPPVVVWPDGRAEFLAVRRGPPTGAMPGVAFRLQRTTLEPGAKLVAYTDGVTEAEQAGHAQYGEARLIEFARACAKLGERETVCALLAEVEGFAAGAEQSDDITIMAIGMPGRSPDETTRGAAG